ncbi:hypothetical protein [Streptomyces rubiginosohelvolus]|uniref:hypothetical protein n=1 Tax=Streptomyces rubiginosohelvolus TaxID=67362 RepID=UPI0036AE7A25
MDDLRFRVDSDHSPDQLTSDLLLVELKSLAREISAEAVAKYSSELGAGAWAVAEDLFSASMASHYDSWAIEAKAHGARARVKLASEDLRVARTAAERRSAARAYLEALADLISCLIRFLVRALILLLSWLLGRGAVTDTPVWTAVPIDTAPQVAPRGPNSAFPVFIYRGGHFRSALGSVVPAA